MNNIKELSNDGVGEENAEDTNGSIRKRGKSAKDNGVSITHIALRLNINCNPTQPIGSYPIWRYVAIRRNPLTNSLYNNRYNSETKRSNFLSKLPYTNAANAQQAKHRFKPHNVDAPHLEAYATSTSTHSPNPSVTMSHVDSSSNNRYRQRISKKCASTSTTSSPSASTTYSACSSSSVDDDLITLSSRRSTGRHSVSVAEFNRFKNGILAKSRSSTAKAEGERTCNTYFLLTYALGSELKQPLNESAKRNNSSTIRAIYEQVERERRDNHMSNVEAKRVDYLNRLKATHELLSASLNIKQLKN